MTTGIDRRTGKRLDGFDHVVQSLYYLFALPIGSRIMRRTVGSAVPIILGRSNLTPPELVRFFAFVVLACELWEPRFKLEQIVYSYPSTSPGGVRAGRLGIRLIGQYRPNALLGDLTPEARNGSRDFVL